jgi:Protein of unknown function (DUF3592).
MPKGMRDRARAVAQLLLVPGVVCLLIGGYFGASELRFHSRAHRASGTLIDEFGFRNHQKREESYDFLYNIDFTTRDGKKVNFQDESVGVQLPWGKPVEVLYDPADPENARLASRERMYLPKRLLPPGLLFCLLGGLLLRWRRMDAPIGS